MVIVALTTPSNEWHCYIVDVDGATHWVDDPDAIAVLADGLDGMLMAPVSVGEREMPLRRGAARQGARATSRRFSLPFWFAGTNAAAVIMRHEQLLTWIDPTRGAGTIVLGWLRPDGTTRELVCSYTGGAEGAEGAEKGVETWYMEDVEFLAHEPDWRDAADTEQTFTPDSVPGTWFPMTFPIPFASSQVVATPNVNNSGTAPEAYPVWTITGPGSNPVVRNLTTGEQFGLTYALGAGETLVIDARPQAPNPVRDGAGNNLWPYATADSALWALVRGTNRLQIEMAGATAASSVVLAYRRRWLRR